MFCEGGVIKNKVKQNKKEFSMNNNCLWAKTILSVYRYLERIAGAIDKIILKNALGSANVSTSNFYYTNVSTVTQKLIDLSERKITLINLKVLIEETLAEVGEKRANILIERYFDNMKFKDLMLKHGFSMRTVFRHLDSSLIAFSKCLKMKGYDDDKLLKMLNGEEWIKSMYCKFAKQEEEDLTLTNVFIAKAVLL